jgi:hypothetical protein
MRFLACRYYPPETFDAPCALPPAGLASLAALRDRSQMRLIIVATVVSTLSIR